MSAWKRIAVVILMLVFFCGVLPTAGQSTVPIPIAVGENKQGELSAGAPVQQFSLSISQPRIAVVQVLGLSPNFGPTVRILGPNGVVIQQANNTSGATIIQATAGFTTPGQYLIEVGSIAATPGQFVISVQGGPNLPAPVALVFGQQVQTDLLPEVPIQQFVFLSAPNGFMILHVGVESTASAAPPRGPVLTLRDAQTGEVFATIGSQLVGTRLRLPPGAINYVLEASVDGTSQGERLSVCLELEGAAPACPESGSAQVVPTAIVVPTAVLPPTAVIPTPTPYVPPVINPAGPCAVASSRGQSINVRTAPNLNASIAGQLAPGAVVPVLMRLPDSSWFQVNVNGLIGWVSATVVISGGNCTIVVTATPTTAPVTVSATLTATATSTASPTPTTPAPVPTLNFSLPPVYGSTLLTSGFVPDPFTVGVNAGGPASASYLGGGCTGFTTSAPTFSVNYTSGAFPLLRFYFIGGGDTTMIINSPSGSFFCVDDSFGTLNPTIDFNSPSSGRYDIWIATFSSGGSVGGTLYVTESTGNHP